uniref:Uncharacterized protein n=1 Tax=Peronospora matthiolae TaxID=2874970 RepID=A0AAV1VAV0_9STRA
MADDARDRAVVATEAADLTRRKQREQVDRLRQLKTGAFVGPQQNESARARKSLSPNRRRRRRFGVSNYEPAQKTINGPSEGPPTGKS